MKSLDKKNLLNRVITAIIAGSVAVTMIVYSLHSLFFLTLVIILLSIAEYLLLVGAEILELSSILVFFSAIVALGLALPEVNQSNLLFKLSLSILILGVPILLTYQLIAHNGHGFDNAMKLWFGLIWLTPSGFFWLLLSQKEQSFQFQIPLGMLFLCWMADTAAYFVGKFFGKHIISEKVSPNKTWEGFVGGIVGNLILSYFLQNYWTQSFSWYWIGFLTVPVGLIGDLVESMFKRSRNIKDSSGLLPGHGGFLDRFDGFFFVIPFNWVIIQLW